MKKHLLVLCAIFFSFLTVSAQVTMTIENKTSPSGNNIPVALNVQNFNNIGSVSLTILYDSSVLTFVQLQNSQLGSATVNSPIPGKLIVGWFDATAQNPLNLGNSKLCDIIFNYTGGNSNITFDVNGTEITNISGTSLALTLNNGSITGGTAQSLSAPTLQSPSNSAVNQSLTPVLNWDDVNGATLYDVQVATDNLFATPLINQTDLSSSIYSINSGVLSNSTTYYWRARARNSTATSLWSSAFSFTTLASGGGATTIKIGQITAPPNSQVNVPVEVTNFTSISSVSLKINYDNSKLTYVGFANSVKPDFLVTAANGVITIAWFDATTMNPLNIASGKLLDLTFNYTSGDLQFSFIESACEVSNSSQQTVTVTYSGGYIFEGEPYPDAPLLNEPANNTVDIVLTPTLSWSAVEKATTYSLQVSSAEDFSAEIINLSGLTSTSYSVPEGTFERFTTYYWRVNSTNNVGTGAWSNVWNFKTLKPPLAQPVLETPADGAVDVSTTPVLNWSDVAEATTYRVQISLLNDISDISYEVNDVTASTLNVPAGVLAESTKYYWRINATDGDRISEWSSIWSFTTLTTKLDLPQLLSPANSTADLQPDAVVLDWSDVDGAAAYTVNIATDQAFANSVYLQSNIATSGHNVPAGKLGFETTYFWRVKASAEGKESDWTDGFSFSTAKAPLTVPGLIAPANNATNTSMTLTLDWDDVSGATKYGLQIASDENFTSMAIDAANLPNSTYSIPEGILTGATKYFWRVNAKDATRISDWSEVRNFTTLDPTSVRTYMSGIPESFGLFQNYPNPFNPSTNIRYSLPEAAEVNVFVVDLLGREVAHLINESQPAGFYEFQWNASNLSSGTYIYKILAKSETGKLFSEVKKLMFVK